VHLTLLGVCVMGVGVATFDEISFKGGRVAQGNPACRRSRRRYATQSSRRQENGSDACRSAIS
jgi:hypothetical protein